jgi:V8-like Glu-specific endopeptidase
MKRFGLAYVALVGLSIMGTACGTGPNGALTLDKTDNTIAQPEFSGRSSQFSNVGVMLMPWGGLCTATLVAPTMVLSAAHCIYQDEHFPSDDFVSDAYSLVFTDANGRQAAFDSARVHALPKADANDDIVIIELSGSVNITPMPIMGNVSADTLGNNVGLVGYGELKPGDTSSLGVLHISGTNVDGLSSNQIEYGSTQTSTSCFGDSGGPVVHQRTDGTYELAGVVHGGSASCDGAAYASRADIHNNWIQSILGQ